MASFSSTETEKSFNAPSPFSGKYFDGVYGFEAKIFVGEYDRDSFHVDLVSSCQVPKKWTVVVKADKKEAFPNLTCEHFSQSSEWKFLLSQAIDPDTLKYQFCDNFLMLKAHHKGHDIQKTKGTKRKIVNEEFSEESVKRFRGELNFEEGIDKKGPDVPLLVETSNILPVEVVSHILQYLDDKNEIRRCALVNKTWMSAVKFLKIPSILTIDETFLTPNNYLSFQEVFQNHEQLPFDVINYRYKKIPTISQQSVLDWIMDRGKCIKIMNVILLFEQHHDFQYCFLLDWISNFKSCRAIKARIRNYVPGLRIDYGNCNLSHVRELVIGADMFQQMEKDLKENFPLNNSEKKFMHIFEAPQVHEYQALLDSQ